MGNPSEDKIIIVGAGVCGLAIAQGLKQAGIPYALYERSESRISKRNWSFSLHWGYTALEKLVPKELLAQLRSAQVDPNRPAIDGDNILLLNGETGEVINRINSDKIYRLRRDKFRDLLLQGLDIQWNKKLADVTYSSDGRTTTVHFTDGTSDTALAVIGCDGAHSAVRTHLVGAENARLDPIGYATAILFTSYTPEQARYLRSPPFHDVFNTSLHPAGYVGWSNVHAADDPDKPEDWILSSYISYPEPKEFVNTASGPELLAAQQALARRFADPIRSMYAWASPERSKCEYIKLQNWDPRKPAHAWDSRDGRVSLAGDGAHAMTFQRGQGLNSAVQDAFEYVEATKRWWSAGADGRAAAVTAYEAEMTARAGAEVQRSADVSDLWHHHFDQVVQGQGMSQGLLRVK